MGVEGVGWVEVEGEGEGGDRGVGKGRGWSSIERVSTRSSCYVYTCVAMG